MNSIPALFLAFAYIVNNIVTTNGAAWKITLFKTKIPTYNREQPTVPRKPSDYCMKGLCPRGAPHICCNYPFVSLWKPPLNSLGIFKYKLLYKSGTNSAPSHTLVLTWKFMDLKF